MGRLLGLYIKEKRKELKFSSLSWSQKIGISKSYLDYIERGLREPRIDILARIAVEFKGDHKMLKTLIELQNKDRLEFARNRLETKKADGTYLDCTASVDSELEDRALALTVAAFDDFKDIEETKGTESDFKMEISSEVY